MAPFRHPLAVLVGLLAAAVSSFAEEPAAREPDRRPGAPTAIVFQEGRPGAAVPLERIETALVTRVSINGEDAGWFIVDTGSTETFIDPIVAERLSLPVMASASMTLNANASRPTSICRIDAFAIGDASVRVRRMLTFNLQPISQNFGVRLGGVLGMDILGLGPFTLDPVGSKLTFHRPDAFKPPPHAGRIEMQFKDGQPLVRVRLMGKHDANLLLDTGFTGHVSLIRAFVDRHPALPIDPHAVDFAPIATGMARTGRLAPVAVECFGRRFERIEAEYQANPSPKDWRYDGLIGMGLIGRFALTIDAAGERCWAEHKTIPSWKERLSAGLDANAADPGGRTALMAAAGAGDLAAVEALIAAGADVNAETNRGGRAITAAAGSGDVAVAAALLKAGAALRWKSNRKNDVLCAAAWGGHRKMVEALIEAGAFSGGDPEGDEEVFIGTAGGGHDAILELLLDRAGPERAARMLAGRALIEAVVADRRATVELLLRRGAKLDALRPAMSSVSIKSADLASPLSVHQLLQGAGHPDRDAPLSTVTALMAAARQGRVELLRDLLKRGAGVSPIDSDRDTVLHHALAAPAQHVAELTAMLLAAGADPNAANDQGQTPLIAAALLDAPAPVIAALLKAGAKADTVTAKRNTALMAAAMRGNEPVVALLIEAGADVNAAGEQGKTPLAYAAQGGSAAVIRALLKHGAKADVKLPGDNTLLILAAAVGHAEACAVLVEAGLNVNHRNEGGGTALSNAASIGYGALPIVRALIKLGADPNGASSGTASALAAAVAAGSDQVVEELLKAGADPHVTIDLSGPDRQTGCTLLHLAAVKDGSHLFPRLLKAGIGVNARASLGWTALMFAVGKRNDIAAEDLLAAGADAGLKNKDGQTALAIAAIHGDKPMIALLEKAAKP